MITRPFADDELPAQFNNFVQIKVLPLYLTIVHALEARIEAAANMNNN